MKRYKFAPIDLKNTGMTAEEVEAKFEGSKYVKKDGQEFLRFRSNHPNSKFFLTYEASSLKDACQAYYLSTSYDKYLESLKEF